MVWLADRPSLRAASCCSVEVVKGGGGLRLNGLVSTEATLNRPSSTARFAASAGPFLPDREAVDLVALVADEAGEELGPVRFEGGHDAPIFLGAEELDLALAIDDEAQRHRLHAAGRFRPRQLAPQHRRQSEADQIVERAPRPVGVDQILVEAAPGAPSLRAPPIW